MKRSYLKYIFALLLFGSNGIIASHIALSSYEIVFLRTTIGSALLLVISLLTEGRFTFLHYKKQFILIVVSGIAMGTSWIFLYEAYQQVGVSIASLAYYCGPVIVMILSPILFQEKLTTPKITGFLMVLAGIFLVNGQVLQERNTMWGLFCGMMSAVMYAIMIISNKKAKVITGMENSAVQLIISFLTVAVIIGARQGFVITVAVNDWLWIIMLGVLNTGLGCYLYFSSIGSLPVQSVAICGYIEPLSAVVLSALILHETLGVFQIGGAVFIIGGAIFGEAASLGHK